MHELSKGRQRGRIGVTFDSSDQTISGIERMLDRGGLTGDGNQRFFKPFVLEQYIDRACRLSGLYILCASKYMNNFVLESKHHTQERFH